MVRDPKKKIQMPFEWRPDFPQLSVAKP